MIILAFETSYKEASVALSMDDVVYEKRIESDLKHEETVLPAAVELIEECGLSIKNIGMVAVDIGPGSFTGIRIGICHANAIADALHIPCIGISSLQAIAKNSNFEGAKGVYIDAGNENCYGAVLDSNNGFIIEPFADTVEAFYKTLSDLDCKAAVCKESESAPTAGAVAKLASLVPSSSFSKELRAAPLYLRPSQAERKIMHDPV